MPSAEDIRRLMNLPGDPERTRVVAAMSGGVDSAVAAALARRAGYDVVGVTLQLYATKDQPKRKGSCCAGQDIYDAKLAAERIGIPHYTLDYEAKFRASVMEDFAAAYARGETPIPCVRCNETVKFRDLLNAAKDMGASALITGHYVQRVEGANGPELHRAADASRDQSYFLFATTRGQLDFVRFPLGGLAKSETRAIAANHFITVNPDGMPDAIRPHAVALGGRAMLVRRARRVDVECVARGYLAGSAWQAYRREGSICGIRLPQGLREGDALPEPIFTPATKATSGHDENITFDGVQRLVGGSLVERLRDLTLALYRCAHEVAAARGLVLADTKFEFGLIPGPTAEELVLIDEALTPDSSRYWDAAERARGSLVALDKQFVRNYLIQIGWNREPPVPALPADVVAATRGRYLETYQRLTGRVIT